MAEGEGQRAEGRLIAWLRRKRTWVLLALGALAAYALFGFFVVPRIVASQIVRQSREKLGREATISRVRFNPFTLAARIEGFRLADKDGAELAAVDRVRVNLEVAGVLRRAVRFRTIKILGPFVAFRILDDGRPSIVDLLEPKPADTELAAPTRPARIIVDRLVLRGGRIAFTDRSRDPAFESRFEPLDLEVRDLITIPEESGEHRVHIGLGQGAEIRWNGQQTVDPLVFTGQFDVSGLDLPWVWSYFGHAQPVEVASGSMDLVLPYRATKAPGQPFEFAVDGASLTARDVAIRDRASAEELLRVPVTEVRDVKAAWPTARVEVGQVRIERPQAILRIDDDARAAATATPPTPAPTPTEPARPWDVAVAAVDIDGGSLRFEDRTTEPDVAFDVTEIGLRLRGASSDLTKAVAVELDGRVGDAGRLHVGGSVAPRPLAAEVEVDMRDVALAAVRPYVSVLPGAVLSSGTTAVNGKLRATGEATEIAFTGTARVDGVRLQTPGGEPLVAWDRLGVDGLHVESSPARVRARSIVIERGFAEVFIDRERNLNLMQFTRGAEVAAATPSTAAAAAPPAKVEIGTVEFRDASVAFTDQSLVLPFGTRIHSMNGTVRDLSTFSAAPATVSIDGRVDETGVVQIGGVVRLADPYASTDLRVAFRSLPMEKLTPYAAEFAGYSVERGLLDLDVRYQLIDRRLLGDHRVVASDFVLGPKVEGSSGAGLPVRLAVALLKDKNGRIDLEVPVEGSIDSPEFAYRKVMWQAIKQILSHVATAPFRALGRLFGSNDDDLELVEFDPGRSDLLPAEDDKLSRLGAEVGPRSELSIEVEGRFDPVSDAAALQRAKLDAAIESRRAEAEAQATATGGSTLETILEGLYTERFSADALAAERTRFEPAPAGLPSATPVPTTTKKSKRRAAPPPIAPQAPAGVFDAAGFYEALRSKLLESFTVSDPELADLARARAQTIVLTLARSGTLDAARCRALDPAPVKRKKAGSERIASEMTMTAAD